MCKPLYITFDYKFKIGDKVKLPNCKTKKGNYIISSFYNQKGDLKPAYMLYESGKKGHYSYYFWAYEEDIELRNTRR